MEPRISLVTIAVADVARSRAFYVDGLGWPVHLEAPGVVMLRVGERQLFSLWDEAEFEAEVGPVRRGAGVAPFTLAHNVLDEPAVDEVLRTAAAAGADVAPAVRREWGGYSGYFADPDGVRWEVACTPPGGELEFLVR